MLKKTITYYDYNGVERTEDFYFNLSKAGDIQEIENVDNPKYNPIEEAYNILVRARDSGSYSDVDLDMIIGYLGEALE